jgi:metallo-beta-lactamase family protein
VELGGARLLVDAGLPVGQPGTRLTPGLADAAHVADALLLTHAHQDHLGAIPALLEAGYDRPILATAATLAVARIQLQDGLRLSGLPESRAEALLGRFAALGRGVAHDAPVTPVKGREVTVTFREAGHILGSASLDLVSPRARVIVSGDLGRPDSPLLRDYCTTWPRDRAVDLVVLESTYGERDHATRPADVEAELERLVKRALRDGGHLLVPAFAVGRIQALLYHLNSLVEAGRLPPLPVALDTPMGLAVTDTYQRFRALFDREAQARIARGDDPLEFHDLYAVNRARDSERLDEVKTPMLIIAGSGMCTGGRIVGHLQALLPRPETCVLFVGYQASGTPGRAIQEAAAQRGKAGRASRVHLGGEDVEVRAEVATLPGLSAHADRGELRRWLRAVPEPRAVAIHHGEPEAQRALAAFLRG